MLGAYVPFAFAAGRRALSLRDEGQGHFLLGEAWVPAGGSITNVWTIGVLSIVLGRFRLCN